MRDGTERVFDLEPVSDTGFHLATGLYGGFDDQFHGQWRGPEHVEGEHLPDCTATDAVARVRQHRQAVVRVEDRATGGVGYGDLQSIVTGAHPDLGLTGGGPRPVAPSPPFGAKLAAPGHRKPAPKRGVDPGWGQRKMTGTAWGPRTRLDGSHSASPAIS